MESITVYGGDVPISVLKEELPNLRVMSMETIKSCIIPYIAAGWTGFIPNECKDAQLHIPEKYTPFLWGYPNKFLKRMENVNTRVILITGDGKWSEGFDTKKDLKLLPDYYDGGLWTNRIDVIGPIIKGK